MLHLGIPYSSCAQGGGSHDPHQADPARANRIQGECPGHLHPLVEEDDKGSHPGHPLQRC